MRSFLRSHPDIFLYGEYFNDRNDLQVLKSLIKKKIDDGKHEVVGFSIQFNQIRDNRWQYIEDEDFYVLLMFRKDMFRVACRLKKNHEWVDKKQGKIRVIKKNVEHYLKMLSKWYEEYYYKADYVLYYEDIVRGLGEIKKFSNWGLLNPLYKDLGIDYRELQCDTVRQNGMRTSEMVVNYYEVINYLRKNKVDLMLK